eukprot:4852348-Pleurochrysis_carterae.AAC.1
MAERRRGPARSAAQEGGDQVQSLTSIRVVSSTGSNINTCRIKCRVQHQYVSYQVRQSSAACISEQLGTNAS